MNWDNEEDWDTAENFRLFCAIVLVLILLAVLLAEQSQAQALPDAPSAVHVATKGADSFVQPKWMTFRGVYRDAQGHQRFNANAPALKTSKKMWLVYALGHGAMFGAWALANHKVEEPSSEIPAMAAVSGADLLMMKFFSPMLSFEAPIYGVQHYLRNR